jgi:hypothetical protein
VDALIRSKTSPWAGRGIGKVRSSTLSFPGKNAARISCCVITICSTFGKVVEFHVMEV